MPDLVKIPFAAGQASSVDPLQGGSPLFRNVLPAGGDAITARPGIRAWSGFVGSNGTNAPVVAMEIVQGNLVYITDDGTSRRVWQATPTGQIELSTVATGTVAGTLPPKIAVSRSAAVIAGGAQPQLVFPGFCDRLPGDPPLALDACWIAQRMVLVAPDSTGTFFWSGTGDAGIGQWDQVFEYREAEAQPDALLACAATSRELFMFGERTTQVFVPDPDETFSATAAVLEAGISARRSVLLYEGVPCWLDDRARIVMSDARSLSAENVLSAPIAKSIDDLSTISDAWAFRARIGNVDLLTWVFPTDGRAFAIDMLTKTWAECNGYGDGRWLPWRVYSHLYWRNRRVHLIGLADGTIGELSFDARTDMGTPINWVARTGALRGPTRRDVQRIQLIMRRGEATDPGSAVRLSWRDDGKDWVDPLVRTFGTSTDPNPVINVAPAGAPHYTREYEVSSTAEEAFLLAEANEQVTLTDW